MTLMKLKNILELLLEKAMESGLSYTDFLRLLALYSHHSDPDSAGLHDVLELIRRLSEEVDREHDSLIQMKQRAEDLVKRGYKPFLVDCFGLPEIYEVYTRVTRQCGSLAVSVEPYINASALTSEFKKTYGSQTMLELAKALGTSLYKSTDKSVHIDLGEPMSLDSLLDFAQLKLKNVAEGLVNDVVRAKRALIISDHGYDVYFSPPDKYYLGHGLGGRLAKVAPLIIVEC